MGSVSTNVIFDDLTTTQEGKQPYFENKYVDELRDQVRFPQTSISIFCVEIHHTICPNIAHVCRSTFL